MPLADANAVSFLSVIVTMGLSVIVLREAVGIRRWLAALLALAGALIIVRPGTEAFQPAALIALLAALFIGVEAVLIKLLSHRESALRILLINNSLGALVACSAAMFFWVAPNRWQWLMLAAIGAIMVLAQTCTIQAMRRMDASFITPLLVCHPDGDGAV